MENDLVVADSKFGYKEIDKIIREEPSRNEKSINDYFLITPAFGGK